MSLRSHLVCIDLCIVSSLEDTVTLSSSSAHQQHISTNISAHQRAPPGRFSSPFRGNNDDAGSSPTQPRFREWARTHFSTTPNRRHDGGIELPERRTEVVDVPLGQARPVSPFFFPSRRSTRHISCRGTTLQERYRWTKKKQGRQRNRRQGRRRTRRTRRTLLRSAHRLPKATSTHDPVKGPRCSQLSVCILLASPLRPHLQPLLRPQSPRAGIVSG
jgi:hypothetical protein